jgi:hypothetical protein
MTKCPGCFQEIPESEYVWICETGRCDRTEDMPASRYAAMTVTTGTTVTQTRPADAKRGWRAWEDVVCPECQEPASEACPTCHRTLLPGWRGTQVTCVAMNGARATGKSLFIAVAVKSLGQLALRLGTTLAYADSKTREVYTDVYERPLFLERGLMAPTPRSNLDSSYQREPLIFSLGMIKGIRRYLVIRDVAGEDMENPPEQNGHLQFLAHADCVLFMFDPLAVPSVRAKLVDLVPAQLQSGGDPVTVLGNFLNLVRGRVPRLGVILSKFDALQELRRVDDKEWSGIMSNTGAAFLRDPSEDSPHYDADDGDLIHEEVKSLLYKLDAGAIVVGLENPHDGRKIPYRFFAVSALGESPDGRQLATRGIAPFRCLDPLKWALSDAGVL